MFKKENSSNDIATFLDINITIENGKFSTKLFDKRDNFGYDIVRMPFASSKHADQDVLWEYRCRVFKNSKSN